jgi:hypothetical protein
MKKIRKRGEVRRKTAAPYRQGANIVLLDPDISAAFPNSGAVNKALREILDAATGRSKRRRA